MEPTTDLGGFVRQYHGRQAVESELTHTTRESAMLRPDMTLITDGWNGQFALLIAKVPDYLAAPLMFEDHEGLTRLQVAELEWFKQAVRDAFGIEELDLVEVSDETEWGCWGPSDHYTDRLVEMSFLVPAGTTPHASG